MRLHVEPVWINYGLMMVFLTLAFSGAIYINGLEQAMLVSNVYASMVPSELCLVISTIWPDGYPKGISHTCRRADPVPMANGQGDATHWPSRP